MLRVFERAMWAVLVLTAVAVTVAGLRQTPTYEASAEVWVGWGEGGRPGDRAARGDAIPLTEGPDEYVELLIRVIDTHPAPRVGKGRAAQHGDRSVSLALQPYSILHRGAASWRRLYLRAREGAPAKQRVVSRPDTAVRTGSRKRTSENADQGEA